MTEILGKEQQERALEAMGGYLAAPQNADGQPRSRRGEA